MNEAIIGIGSNQNATRNVATALCRLNDLLEVIRTSEILITKACGDRNQPDYLNCVVRISTELSQKELKKLLKKIEVQLGRDRSDKLVAIDLDIVAWNGCIVDNDYFERDYLKRLVDAVM